MYFLQKCRLTILKPHVCWKRTFNGGRWGPGFSLLKWRRLQINKGRRLEWSILRGPFYFYLNILPKGGKKKQHSQHIKPKVVYTFYTEALFKMYLARSPLQERLNKACFRQSSWCCSLERERTKEVQAENLAGHVATSFRNLRICKGRSI